MSIKNGVRFASPEMAMCHATMVVEAACGIHGVSCVITGGIENHEHPSKHVYGGGLDYRTRQLADSEAKSAFAATVERLLGDGFDVVLEVDHLHVEYDPKS